MAYLHNARGSIPGRALDELLYKLSFLMRRCAAFDYFDIGIIIAAEADFLAMLIMTCTTASAAETF